MKITFEGRDWDLDTEHIRFQHAMGIQSWTGMSIAGWEDSLDFETDEQGNVKNPPPEWLKSIGALYWLMLAQNDVTTPIADVDFDLSGFLEAFMAALAAEIAQRKADAAPEPDPTPPPSPAAAPPSPAPSTQTATTPMPAALPEGDPLTVS